MHDELPPYAVCPSIAPNFQRLVGERIKRLKYAYLRCVDQKSYDELRSLLGEDSVRLQRGSK